MTDPSRPDQTDNLSPDNGPEKESPDATDEDTDIGAAEDDAPEQVSAEVAAELESQLAQHREALLRAQAEMENLRKRLDREMDKTRRFALERFMKDLLPVRDSLERGLETAAGDSVTVEQLVEGKAMTLKLLDKTMEDHGLQLDDPEGEAFNPERHEAMTTQPSDEVEPGQVLKTLQKGFLLNDRVIRPAMVIVSAKAAE